MIVGDWISQYFLKQYHLVKDFQGMRHPVRSYCPEYMQIWSLYVTKNSAYNILLCYHLKKIYKLMANEAHYTWVT